MMTRSIMGASDLIMSAAQRSRDATVLSPAGDRIGLGSDAPDDDELHEGHFVVPRCPCPSGRAAVAVPSNPRLSPRGVVLEFMDAEATSRVLPAGEMVGERP
jgi:hypothetical protein